MLLKSLATTLAVALVGVPLTGGAQSRPTASAVPVRVAGATQVDTVDRIVAVVGSSAITWSDLAAAVNQQRASGMKLPVDVAGQREVARNVLNDLVDEEILVQQAKDLKLDVAESEITAAVDRQIKDVRGHFQSDAEYRTELKNAGFGSPEEYRRTLLDQFRRRELQRRAFAELQKRAKPASVTEEEVTAAFDRARGELQKRPATIAFRQIVVAPKASAAADARARVKADSILVELKKGANFEETAKRESMDPGTKNVGGDLGWNRRGSGLVPEFESMMFALRPGELSPVFKTPFGYHIIRVDRVQPAEVKASHILIAPVIDSNDVHVALLRADTVAMKWRNGVSFDSLVAKYHDPAEEKGVLQPYPIDSLPASYRTALTGVKAPAVANPFALATATGSTKYAVVQVVSRTEPGEYSLAEVRDNIRAQLAAEKQTRALLDALRKETYVSLRL
ncbi:MAG: peptidylprolyl isomerase [Gemmatimonadaceae bacterium]